MRVQLGLVLLLGHELVRAGPGFLDPATYGVRLLFLQLCDPGFLLLRGLLRPFAELGGLLGCLQSVLLSLLRPVGGDACTVQARLHRVTSWQRIPDGGAGAADGTHQRARALLERTLPSEPLSDLPPLRVGGDDDSPNRSAFPTSQDAFRGMSFTPVVSAETSPCLSVLAVIGFLPVQLLASPRAR